MSAFLLVRPGVAVPEPWACRSTVARFFPWSRNTLISETSGAAPFEILTRAPSDFAYERIWIGAGIGNAHKL